MRMFLITMRAHMLTVRGSHPTGAADGMVDATVKPGSPIAETPA